MGRLLRYNLVDTAASIGTLIIGAHLGLQAAAMSRIAYGLIWLAIYARFMQRLVGFSWRRMADIYARSAVVAVATATPSLLLYRYWRSPETLGWDGLLLAVASSLSAWMLSLLLTRHPGLNDLLGMVRHAFGQLLKKPAPRAA
jgi:hypothetical protein